MNKVITLIITLTLGLLFQGNLNAQEPGKGFDVQHYEIHLSNFDFVQKTLEGDASITVVCTEAIGDVILELNSLEVDQAIGVGMEVFSYVQDGDRLILTLYDVLTPGQEYTFQIHYSGHTFCDGWGGVNWWGSDYVYSLGVGFESIPHNLGKTWFPCVDDFNDKATYDIFVTVPSDKKGICGGNLVATTDNGDGTTTWHWNTPQETATYHQSFAVGFYELWEDTYQGINGVIPITVYARPEQFDKVDGTFVHIKEIIAFFEEHLGAYPFNRVGYVSTGNGCMESTDNIAMSSSLISGNTDYEEYVAHELSHMWFGNKVTCSSAEDMWLNEGFGQFWGIFFRSGVYGEDNFHDVFNSTMNSIMNWCRKESNWIPLNDVPLEMTYDGSAVYDRGAVIVNTMMNYMGREPFFAALRHYLDTYAYRSASSEQLRDALTEASGIDMNGFFDTYVFTPGLPHYDVDILNVEPDGNRYDVTVRASYQHIGSAHVGQNNRVEVTFFDEEGQFTTEKILWDGATSECTVNLGFSPTAAFVDYDNHFLDAKNENHNTVTSPDNITLGNNKICVVSVTDSVMAHIENHFVGPSDDPDIPGLTLSTSHYWKIYHHEYGPAVVNGLFTYSNTSSLDGDIIHTENDSAVLLYRADIHDTWHSIPYTQQGNWKLGQITVNNIPDGYYTIAVIDKTTYGLNDYSPASSILFPNPASDYVTLLNDAKSEGPICLYNQQLQLVKTLSQPISEKYSIFVGDLSKGIYYLKHDNNIHKLIIQ